MQTLAGVAWLIGVGLWDVSSDGPVLRRRSGVKLTDAGEIMFVCPGRGRHQEKEVVIIRCPCCRREGYFVFQDQRFYCFGCARPFPPARIQCPDCGLRPTKIRIKHR